MALVQRAIDLVGERDLRLVYIGVFAWQKRPTVSPKISMIFLSQDNQCYDRTLGVTF